MGRVPGPWRKWSDNILIISSVRGEKEREKGEQRRKERMEAHIKGEGRSNGCVDAGGKRKMIIKG